MRERLSKTARRLSKMSLLAKFSLLSVGPVVTLGVVLAHALGGQVRERTLEDTRQKAELIARLGVEPNLSPAELRRGLRRRREHELRRALRAKAVRGEVAGITVWNRRGQVAYSDDRQVLGRPLPGSPALASALAGRTEARLAGPGEAGDPRDPKLARAGQLLAVYVPLRFGSETRPAGALEMHLPYRPIAAAVERDTGKLYLILFLGLGLLCATLFRIVMGASRRLRHQALHDALTDLPNRTLFYERVQQTIGAAPKGGPRVALLLVDLDRFKEINDTLGHHNGDALLKEVGPRMSGALRDTDTIARLGGDEFAVLLTDASGSRAATRVADRVAETLEEPFELQGLSVDLDASIGIAFYPEHGTDVDTLLQRADVAMYRAKEAQSGYEVYAPGRDKYSPERLALVGELRRAIDNLELVLYYQPKVELHSGSVIGVEALLRWQHPRRGVVAPDEFIPLAERTGLMRPLTLYVLKASLQQCRAWQQAGFSLSVAVNLATRNLLDLRLSEDIARLLNKWNVHPASLELEITEGTIMADPVRSMEVLTRFSAMGVGLAVDDFGTGYSSLAYLKRLPVDEIKMDKSFVMNMTTNENDAAIVRSTIDLGRNLGLRVVAEGVANEEIWTRLLGLGCHVAQGYYLSPPVAPAELTTWLERWTEASAASRAASASLPA